MANEITDMLVKQFPDEINDSNMYYNLSLKASSEWHDQRFAKCLFEISKDEYTHAKFIHDFMVMNGMCLPEDLKCKWMTLEQRAHKIYPDVPKCMYDM